MLHERSIWRTMIAGSCGALNVFVDVVRIRSDAFWFSAVRYFHGDNTGSNPVGDANNKSIRLAEFSGGTSPSAV